MPWRPDTTSPAKSSEGRCDDNEDDGNSAWLERNLKAVSFTEPEQDFTKLKVVEWGSDINHGCTEIFRPISNSDFCSRTSSIESCAMDRCPSPMLAVYNSAKIHGLSRCQNAADLVPESRKSTSSPSLLPGPLIVGSPATASMQNVLDEVGNIDTPQQPSTHLDDADLTCHVLDEELMRHDQALSMIKKPSAFKKIAARLGIAACGNGRSHTF